MLRESSFNDFLLCVHAAETQIKNGQNQLTTAKKCVTFLNKRGIIVVATEKN
jgi:hypothetical protein